MYRRRLAFTIVYLVVGVALLLLLVNAIINLMYGTKKVTVTGRTKLFLKDVAISYMEKFTSGDIKQGTYFEKINWSKVSNEVVNRKIKVVLEKKNYESGYIYRVKVFLDKDKYELVTYRYEEKSVYNN